jgi:hypothetical protein
LAGVVVRTTLPPHPTRIYIYIYIELKHKSRICMWFTLYFFTIRFDFRDRLRFHPAYADLRMQFAKKSNIYISRVRPLLSTASSLHRRMWCARSSSISLTFTDCWLLKLDLLFYFLFLFFFCFFLKKIRPSFSPTTTSNRFTGGEWSSPTNSAPTTDDFFYCIPIKLLTSQNKEDC